MDNRIFNVNGRGKEDLRAVLKVAFKQEGDKTKAGSWIVTKKQGLILRWDKADSRKGAQNFLTGLDADTVADMVWAWLNSPAAKETECTGWDADHDHDGSNSEGWRVFVEDWGHVDGDFYAICAIKPAFLWHGK